jgi:hypothetical protein
LVLGGASLRQERSNSTPARPEIWRFNGLQPTDVFFDKTIALPLHDRCLYSAPGKVVLLMTRDKRRETGESAETVLAYRPKNIGTGEFHSNEGSIQRCNRPRHRSAFAVDFGTEYDGILPSFHD